MYDVFLENLPYSYNRTLGYCEFCYQELDQGWALDPRAAYLQDNETDLAKTIRLTNHILHMNKLNYEGEATKKIENAVCL